MISHIIALSTGYLIGKWNRTKLPVCPKCSTNIHVEAHTLECIECHTFWMESHKIKHKLHNIVTLLRNT